MKFRSSLNVCKKETRSGPSPNSGGHPFLGAWDTHWFTPAPILKTRARSAFKGESPGRIDPILGSWVPYPARTLPNESLTRSIGGIVPLRGNASSDGEPARVTDKAPARVSAGRGGPVDYGLPFSPPPWLGITGKNSGSESVSSLLFFTDHVNG